MKRKIQISILIFTLATTLLGIYVYKWEYREERLEVNFLSLNKGRSIFIRTSDNKTILYGGGQNSQTIAEITRLMPFYDRRIDYVVIPSATAAQIGGLIEILERHDIGEVIKPSTMSTSTVLTQLMKTIQKNKIHVVEVNKGDTIDIGKMRIQILFPYEVFKYNKTSLPELGVRIDYQNTNLYLMGNLSKTIQKSISKEIEDDMESILELYNSGIESKVSKNLVEVIEPKYIFTTKEKSIRFVSDGFFWSR